MIIIIHVYKSLHYILSKGTMEFFDEVYDVRRRISYMARYERRQKLKVQRGVQQTIHALNIFKKQICKHKRLRRKLAIIDRRFQNSDFMRINMKLRCVHFFPLNMPAQDYLNGISFNPLHGHAFNLHQIPISTTHSGSYFTSLITYLKHYIFLIQLS